MKRLVRTRVVWLGALLAGLVFCAIPLTGDEYVMQTACLVLFYGYLGSCWNILGGYAGQLSYAHPTYLGLGAYTSSILFLRYGVSPWLGMFAGGAIAAVVAVGIGFPCFRLRGPFYALMTIAFLEVSRLLALNLSGLTGGPLGLIVQGWGDRPWHFQFRGYGPYLWIMAGLVAVVLTVTYVLEKSKLGYYLVAIRENQEAAAALGVDHTRAKLIAAAISAFFTALGGTYYAQFAGFIEPDVVMGMGMAIQIILMAIIGGKGTLFGPLVGAVCLVPVAEILRGEFGGGTAGLHLAVYGTLLIVIMLFVPQGIVGSIRSTIRRRARLSSVVDG